MECKYNQDEFCVNADCPMRGDYCPVPYIDGICKYEDREAVTYSMSLKGCFIAALLNNDIHLGNDVIDAVWGDFIAGMTKFGHVEESE